MWKKPLAATFVVALFACGGSTVGGIDLEEIKPTNPVVVQPPATSLEIKATLTAATLGDDCGSGSGDSPAAGACAPLPDGGSCGGRFSCQQSNVQIAFEASGSGKPAKVEIASVKLLEVGTEAVVDTLTAREPQTWDGTQYSAWDETLASGDRERASYKLSAPRWNGWNSFRAKYVLEIVIKLDGVRRTLRSSEITREPVVAT